MVEIPDPDNWDMIVFDVESNGLLDDATKIHCLSYIDTDREKDIITVSSMNKEVIFMYEAYIHGADGFGKPRPQMKTDLSKTSGYVGRIDEARKKFEKIFKDSTESP